MTAARRPAVSLARALSKLGVCSRADAEAWIRAGRVRVAGRVAREPSLRVDPDRDAIAVDGRPVRAAPRVYLALNKPRGVVVSREDARGAPTVFDLIADAPLAAGVPHLSAVGRLDKASEGLLLLTNDTRWAARLLDPASHVDKTYHVQVDAVPDDALLDALLAGVPTPEGEVLAARAARLLRSGGRTAWLELVLDEGRNRHIRRMLAARGVEVLRLVRVAIGALPLGDLPKGALRSLSTAERRALTV
ncbi:pseudouridine synthase [Roseisolibacter sp. H3M3-2]|uniref:pseudouridine synthase n=1 Tax=Roseisolibacter sp. H3M3-2 TaxID=3031323 RepID=UPI0023DBE8C8|nr:pseudouridine synthase [Roseisolibacter sp. H3M3-2]MDF1503673.1 pseudouridine synthase [Roseisolibacter sp. H3M3-2]